MEEVCSNPIADNSSDQSPPNHHRRASAVSAKKLPASHRSVDTTSISQRLQKELTAIMILRNVIITERERKRRSGKKNERAWKTANKHKEREIVAEMVPPAY